MGTRVLKAHTEALIESLPAAKVAFGVTHNLTAFAAILAEAVVSATDRSKTRYVIVGRTELGRPMVFGLYVTYQAALRALRKPLPIKTDSTWIVPMYPHPQREGKISE